MEVPHHYARRISLAITVPITLHFVARMTAEFRPDATQVGAAVPSHDDADARTLPPSDEPTPASASLTASALEDVQVPAGPSANLVPVKSQFTKRYEAKLDRLHANPPKRRFKPVKELKVHKTVMQIVAMRANGMARQEIADQLGITMNTYTTYLSRGRAQGWINSGVLTNTEDIVDTMLKDKAVRNVEELLDARSEKMSIEAAKGLGIFKAHQVIKGEGLAPQVLALRVDVQLPAGASEQSLIKVNPANVGGTYARGIPDSADVLEGTVES